MSAGRVAFTTPNATYGRENGDGVVIYHDGGEPGEPRQVSSSSGTWVTLMNRVCRLNRRPVMVLSLCPPCILPTTPQTV